MGETPAVRGFKGGCGVVGTVLAGTVLGNAEPDFWILRLNGPMSRTSLK